MLFWSYLQVIYTWRKRTGNLFITTFFAQKEEMTKPEVTLWTKGQGRPQSWPCHKESGYIWDSLVIWFVPDLRKSLNPESLSDTENLFSSTDCVLSDISSVTRRCYKLPVQTFHCHVYNQLLIVPVIWKLQSFRDGRVGKSNG